MIAQKEYCDIDKIKSQVVCPVELALRILGGKWKGSIMYQLKDGPLRFNELRNRVQDAVVEPADGENFLSNKVLSAHLNYLMDLDLLVNEKSDLNSSYALSLKGESAIPILIDLFYWGQENF